MKNYFFAREHKRDENEQDEGNVNLVGMFIHFKNWRKINKNWTRWKSSWLGFRVVYSRTHVFIIQTGTSLGDIVQLFSLLNVSLSEGKVNFDEGFQGEKSLFQFSVETSTRTWVMSPSLAVLSAYFPSVDPLHPTDQAIASFRVIGTEYLELSTMSGWRMQLGKGKINSSTRNWNFNLRQASFRIIESTTKVPLSTPNELFGPFCFSFEHKSKSTRNWSRASGRGRDLRFGNLIKPSQWLW